MQETVFDALRQREFVSACLARLRRCGAPRVPDSAAASDVALLAWLRDPAINAAIDWPVDRILPTDRAAGDSGGVIAHENQDIWRAYMPPGEAVAEVRTEVCATPESGTGKGDPLVVLPLSELLVRVLMPRRGFATSCGVSWSLTWVGSKCFPIGSRWLHVRLEARRCWSELDALGRSLLCR